MRKAPALSALAALALGLFALAPAHVRAQDDQLLLQEIEQETPPPLLEEIENLPREFEPIKQDKDEDNEVNTGLPFDIRKDALKEAALSYGARGGLARRTYEIRLELERRAGYLDRIYDFRQLLMAAPSGLLIEPPIISEAENALIIEEGGLTAAVSDRLYQINVNARIVSAPRTWRSYLERSWGKVAPPPDVLRPTDEEERAHWKKHVREGWAKGYEQADEIFLDDLNRLVADYTGMVRYRMLLTQDMVSPPFALQVDRGVTGGGDEMRVGDRSVQITGLPELKPGYDQWQPANR